MTNMFKKTLVAASLIATFGVSAGTVSVTKQTHSMEGLAGVTATQTSNAIGYVLGAAYAVGDKITFTFPTGALVAASFPSQLNISAVDSDTLGDAIAGLALGLLNSDADSVTYRVTSLAQPSNLTGTITEYTDRTTIGATLPLGAVGYTPASVMAANVTVTVDSLTSVGDFLDTSGTRTGTVAEAKTQFGSAVVGTMFAKVINVSDARESFTIAGADSAVFTVTNPTTTGWLNMATVNTTGANFFGEAGKMTGLAVGDFAAAGTRTFTEAAAQLSVSYTGMITNDTISFTAPGDVALEAQKFTTDVVYNYTSAGAATGTTILATGADSGEWTLNGATVNIPYMPYGAGISQIIYVSNSGTQSGDVSVTAFDDNGASYDLGVVGVANANTVTKLSSIVGDALVAAGFNGSKASLTITVNAPSDDITVQANYVAGGSRATVITDQYKN